MDSSNQSPKNRSAERAPASNFLRAIVEADLARGTDAGRTWTGRPPAEPVPDPAGSDPAPIRTRFPPEPNGYLHIGHAKSVCLNFGLAREFDGVCHMRFDDTNPVKEDQEYVDSIKDTIHWLGFDWTAKPFERARASVRDHLYFASDYFERLYEFAQYLIETGYAYVDSQSADEMRAARGTLTTPGSDSVHRNRTVTENLEIFHAMRAGRYPDGAHVLRARIDMASPNMNMRDPVLYRIRHAEHHRTGTKWCIYPMYDYTHCISDALENITHSICTLEFEDHRPLYDWVLERIVALLRPAQFRAARERLLEFREQGLEAQKEFALHCHNFAHKLGDSAPELHLSAMFKGWEHDRGAVLAQLDEFFALLTDSTASFTPLLAHALDESSPNPFALPHQYEFSRLNLTYVVTSKRKLLQMVTEGHVSGWDDPRMPTLVGLRRRGYTPQSLQLFCERLGVSRVDSWIDYALLEQALRDDLDVRAPRATAVLEPLRLIIENMAADHDETCSAPVHPHQPAMGVREFRLTRDLWIEADDFRIEPPKGYFRLFPGGRVRLRHGYVVECTGFETDEKGAVNLVRVKYLPETKSGTPGADSIKVKGNIHWVSASEAISAEVRLFERLFSAEHPDAGDGDYLERLNPDSRRVVTALIEPGLAGALAEERYQFERHGYFVVDRYDSQPGALVFNRVATLKDSWTPRS